MTDDMNFDAVMKEFVDNFITDRDVVVTLVSPAGTEGVIIADNMGNKALVNIFITMQGFISSFKQMAKEFGATDDMICNMIDALFELAKSDILHKDDEEDGSDDDPSGHEVTEQVKQEIHDTLTKEYMDSEYGMGYAD